MSTNRPFFSNFLSAFRARSGFQTSTSPTGGVSGASLTKAQKAAAASTLSSTTTAAAMVSSASTSTNAAAQANSAATSTSSRGTATMTQSAIPPMASNPAPRMATATTTSASAHGVPYQRQHHHKSSYSRSPGTSAGGPTRGFLSGTMSPSSTTANQATGRRRGSDSSSEGFREIMGSEKWYIGGRTAAGEEKFYRLSMVRRPRSVDRLSADRLSL